MNETPEDPPYAEDHSWVDYKLRPHLTNGWCYPRDASSTLYTGYRPPPTGPCEYILPFSVENMVKAIEIKYEFNTGTEAEIQAVDEGSPVHRISAPGGHLIVPVGPSRQWMIRLPAGVCVHAHIEKWQKDLEAMERRRREWRPLTPEDEAMADKYIAEWETRRSGNHTD